jgi:hypothetical protein
MIQKFLSLILCLFLAPAVLANTDTRKWQLADGTKMNAALMEFDEKTGTVKIKKTDGTMLELKLSQLGAVDKAWLKKFQNLQGEMLALLKKVGGAYEQRQAEGREFTTSYYIYYPTCYKKDKNQPLLLLFHPGGQGQRFLKRHILAAEKAGVIIVCPDVFRNTKSSEPEVWKALDRRFTELYADIKTNVEYDKNNFYMGGSSGGAARAYHYAAEQVNECKGIYANGGWLCNQYDLPYPAMRIAMINGHKDGGANNYVEPDSKVLKARGSIVKLFVFEGGHQVAPTETQLKAMIWMLENRKFYIGFSKDVEKMAKVVQFPDDQKFYSTAKAHEIAFKIFTQVNFVGMKKETVLSLLGKPEDLNSFAPPRESDTDSPLVYFFADGETVSGWNLTFKAGEVTSVQQYFLEEE